VSDAVALQIDVDDRGFRRKLDGASRRTGTFARNIERSFNRASTAAGRFSQRVDMLRRKMSSGVMARGGGLVKAGAGMVGAMGFGQALMETKDFETRLRQFGANTGNMNNAFVNKTRQTMFKVSEAYGIGKGETIAYAEAVAEATGSASLAVGTLDSMGKVAIGTGSKLSDLAGVVTGLAEKMDVSEGDIMTVMDVFASQADKGAFELKNMATEMNSVLSLVGKFDLKGIEGARTVGAVMQLARRGTGSSAEAATAAERFFQNTARNQDAITASTGVQFFNKSGKRRDFNKILLELGERWNQLEKAGVKFDKTGKVSSKGKISVAKRANTLFGIYGERVLTQFVKNAQRGNVSTATSASFSDLRNVKTGALAQKVAFMQEGEGAKWDRAVAKMSNTIHKQMLPVLREVTKIMPDLAWGLKKAFEYPRELIMVWAVMKGRKLLLGGRAAWAATAGGAGGVGDVARVASLGAKMGGGGRGGRGPAGAPAGGPGGFYTMQGGGGWAGRGGMRPGEGWHTGGRTAPRPQGGILGRAGAWYGRNMGRDSFLGRHSGKLGMAGAIAGGFVKRGALGGGKGEAAADVAASVAMTAGGPLGLLAGGGYFAGKAVFNIAEATLKTEKLDTGGYKEYADRGLAFRALSGRAETVGYKRQTSEQAEATGAALKKALASGSQAEVKRTRASFQAQLEKRKQQLTGGHKETVGMLRSLTDAQKKALAPGIAQLEGVIRLLGNELKEMRIAGQGEEPGGPAPGGGVSPNTPGARLKPPQGRRPRR
jgi:hypothetical protein